MPLPLIAIAASAIAGATGIAAAGVGGKKMLGAKKEMKAIEAEHESNLRRLEEMNEAATSAMDELGSLEIEVCKSFEGFTRLFEQIKNRPEFDEIEMGNFEVPKYDPEELKKVALAAGAVVGAVGGAGLGAASGLGAAFAAKGAIAAVCVASTGTPIASLSGAAATNAIMAVLGGGTVAAGGGGVALGTTVLGVASAGVGILVGGIVFAIVGRSMCGKVDEARRQKDEAAAQINAICEYLGKLKDLASRYRECLDTVYEAYYQHMRRLWRVVFDEGRSDWHDLAADERLDVENLVLLVSILYRMCNLNLVIESEEEGGLNEVNLAAAQRLMSEADSCLRERGLS